MSASPQLHAPSAEVPVYDGQPINLGFGGEGPDSRVLASAILSFKESEQVTVSMPVWQGGIPSLSSGTAVSFHIADGDVVRAFPTRVASVNTGPAPSVVLHWPDGMVRVNRRNAVRTPTYIPADVTYDNPLRAGVALVVRGTTLDLSEGGMRLVVPAPIAPGTNLSVRLQIPDMSPQVCGGRVVCGGTTQPQPGEVRHWVGVELSNLSTPLERTLRRYLWGVQRGHLRKDLR